MNNDKPLQWFRMYSEFATDPKVQMLSESYQRRYVMLLCLRCCNGDVTLHDEVIAFQLRISIDDWNETKAVFIDKKLIGNDCKPIAWDKRQYSSDSSTERVQKHRKNKETEVKRYSNGDVTPPETEAEADTEADTEIKPKTSTTEGARKIIKEVLEEKHADLIRLFPKLDIPVVAEKLLSHYSGKSPPLDPWMITLKWFQNEKDRGENNGNGRTSGSTTQDGRKTGIIAANGPGTDFLS